MKVKHKVLSVFLAVFMVLALFGIVQATVYRKTGRVGNASGDMDSIDGATLNDGDECRVFEGTSVFLWYRLDADSGVTPDDYVVIDPNDNPGSKRWILQDNSLLHYTQKNALDYGSAYTDATLQLAITDLSTNHWSLLVNRGTWVIDADLTFAANTRLKFEEGAVFDINQSGTDPTDVVINGDIDAGLYQVFDVDANSSISLGKSKELYAEWFGALGDSDGTTGNGTDNILYFQDALNTLNTSGGGVLSLCSNTIYRLSGTIRGYGDTTITGDRSSVLFFDSNNFGNTPGKIGDYDDFLQAGIIFHSDTTNPTKVTARSYSAYTYLENCWVKGITLKGIGAYGETPIYNNIGIRFHGCKNSGVTDCLVENLFSSAIYANEVGYNIQFKNNTIQDCAFDGLNFNGRIHNSQIVGNRCYMVSQPVEVTGWDNIVDDNEIDTYDLNGILLGDDILDYEVSCNVTNNRITNGTSAAHYGILQQNTTAGMNVSITNNYVRGANNVGIYVSTADLSGSATSVIGNTVVEEATENVGGCILGGEGKKVFISANNVKCTTGYAYAAILANSASSEISIVNNYIDTNVALRGAATNYCGVIQYPDGYPIIHISDNIVNGQKTTSPRYAFDNEDDTPSVQYGQYFVCADPNPLTITMFDDGVDDQEIFVYFAVSTTTLDFTGTDLFGNGGVDWTPTSTDFMRCVYNKYDWYCDCEDVTP